MKFLFPLIEKGFQGDFEYYLFKLDPFFRDNYEHLSKILAYENYNSIIDKYLTLIKVFQYSIVSLDKKNSDLKQMLSHRLYYLKKKVMDSEVEKLNSILDDEFTDYPLSLNDVRCIKCLDYYTIGKYEEVLEETKKIIIENPLNIELLSYMLSLYFCKIKNLIILMMNLLINK